MKKAQMNISHFRFILFNLKIFDEIPIVTAKQVPAAETYSRLYILG